MAKLTRKLLKQFASSAGAGEIDVFGSLAADALATSTDPDDIQSLSAWLEGQAGAVLNNDSPVLEDRNAVDFVFSYMLKTIFQMGVPEYLSTETYYLGSLVNSSGVLYRSLSNSNTGNAVSDTTNWALLERQVTGTRSAPATVGGSTGVSIAASAPTQDVYLVGTAPSMVSRSAASADSWFAITWSPDLALFVAVADSHIMTSPDGITWTSRTAAEGNALAGVAWSPELTLFAVVSNNGTNRVQTSPDGITWTVRSAAASNTWRKVCWAPKLNLFCAVASSGTGDRIMTSPNGTSWTSRTNPEDNSWNDVCFSPELNLFVAVAEDGTNRVMTSPDGITWTARAAAGSCTWISVTWAAELGLFCAVANGGTGRVMTSPNGITWTLRTAAEANGWHSIAYAPRWGTFLAVAQDGTNRAMRSPDGITWTAVAAAAANTWQSVFWAPAIGRFAAVSSDGTNRVQTYSVALITANPSIAVGTIADQRLALIGTSDINAVAIATGNGVFCRSSIYLKSNSIITLMWDAVQSLWVQVAA